MRTNLFGCWPVCISCAFLFSSFDAVAQEYVTAQVTVIDTTKARGFTIGVPAETKELLHDMDAELGKTFLEVEVVCWATKVIGNRIPPLTREEVIVIGKTKDAEVWLIYLAEQFYGKKGVRWHNPNPEVEHVVRWKKSVENTGILDDDSIANFIDETNFGNNELSLGADPRIIYYYGKSDVVKDRLAKGVGLETRQNRFALVFRATGKWEYDK